MAQIDNPELVRNLTPHFHKRSDLALNLAHSISFMQAIPGLVGFWVHGDRDLSGYGNNMAGSGTIITHVYDNNIVPYAQYDRAGTAFLSVADAAIFDITGTESQVDSSYHGLTAGGWWQLSQENEKEYLMAKWDSSPNKSWLFMKDDSVNGFQFFTSSDGSSQVSSSSLIEGVMDTWFFAVVRWIPSTEVKFFYALKDDINLTTVSDTSSIDASLFSGAADVFLGHHGASVDPLDGRSSFSFLIRGNVPDLYIETFFDLTSPLFAAT